MLYYVLPALVAFLLFSIAASLAPPTPRGNRNDRSEKPGVEMRRQVMGDAFVDRALGNATEFTQPLQDFVNEHAWGSVWNREGLPLKTRSLITLAALTALEVPAGTQRPRARRAEQRLHGGGNSRSAAALRGVCRCTGGDRCVSRSAGSD